MAAYNPGVSACFSNVILITDKLILLDVIQVDVLAELQAEIEKCNARLQQAQADEQAKAMNQSRNKHLTCLELVFWSKSHQVCYSTLPAHVKSTSHSAACMACSTLSQP